MIQSAGQCSAVTPTSSTVPGVNFTFIFYIEPNQQATRGIMTTKHLILHKINYKMEEKAKKQLMTLFVV